MFESSSMWVVACLKVALFVTECATLQYEADLEDLHDHVTVKVPAQMWATFNWVMSCTSPFLFG